MSAMQKAPDELRELAGLELNRRRLRMELIAVHVAIDKLQCQIQERGIDVTWIKRGVPKTVAPEVVSVG
jgi:hypothetical protein